MPLQYDEETKKHYMDDGVAEKYHQAFSSGHNLRDIRFKLVAMKERNAVLNYLKGIKHDRVLDIPTGTGKLAPIFHKLDADVTACDISENMLRIAERVYAEIGYKNVKFSRCDAAKITEQLDERFDVVVCLRLLHRVPKDVRKNILEQLSSVAGHAIVSYGVETTFHKVRRYVRSLLFGGGKDSLCYENINVIEEELGGYFDIKGKSWVIPYISQEIVYLLIQK